MYQRNHLFEHTYSQTRHQLNRAVLSLKSHLEQHNGAQVVQGKACTTLALGFAENNFDRENERNYIMQVTCEATVCPDVRVRQVRLPLCGACFA
jgi:hypothetical protein